MIELKSHKDTAWIQRIKENSDQYLKELYLAHQEDLHAWLIKNYQIPKEDVKDIYHETIFIFYQNIIDRKLETLSCSVKTYLFAVAKHLAINYNRKRGKELFVEQDKFEYKLDSHSIDAYKTTNEEPINEHSEQMVEIIKHMIEPCKSIITGYYYEQLSLKELSSKLNYASANVVKVQKHRCMSKIMRSLKEKS